MRLKFFFVLLVFPSCILLQAQSQSNKPKSYIAYTTGEVINIDGSAHEKSWELAPWTSDFVDIQGDSIPIYNTKLKMLWDQKYFYVYVKMEDDHIWGTLKQRDTVIFYNNDFEMFIDPDGDTHNYMEIEINALNTVWDLFLSKPYREGGRVLNHWDIKGLKSAVSYNGTLNNPSDTDIAWNLELAIPWEALREAGGLPPKDHFWRINFSRVQWKFDLIDNRYQRKKDSLGEFEPESNWVWSPQRVINMHEPEHWGYVFFSSKVISEQQNQAYTIPIDEHIKWKMYRLYREQKAFYRKHKNWATELKSLYSDSLIIKGKLLKPELQVHNTGWNISVRSPFTSNLLIIRQDGDFITKTNY